MQKLPNSYKNDILGNEQRFPNFPVRMIIMENFEILMQFKS